MISPTRHMLLTPQEVADILHLGKSTIYRLAADRKIDCVRFGRSVRFKSEDVDSFIEKNRIEQSFNGLLHSGSS